MPRINPLELLACLSVLLSRDGGILSPEEVTRLFNLMTKFSKKLVSKCVYILILRNSDRNLVNMFMAEGGWNLIYTWLQDAIHISNWELVKEILDLLLMTPVDVERLKLNSIPKLVKSLSRLEEVKGVQDLSTQLVHDWLIIVKGNTKSDDVKHQPPCDISDVKNNAEKTVSETVDSSQLVAEGEGSTGAVVSTGQFYKVTVRDGKQVISRAPSIDEEHPVSGEGTAVEPPPKPEALKEKDKKEERTKERSSSSKHSSSRHKSSSHKSSSSRDKHKSSSSTSSSKHKSSSSKSRDRDKKDRDKDKHKPNGATKSELKQTDKDKDTLAKLKPQSIEKLGRIPKKTDDKSKDKEIKKPTMSIEVRKNTEERPKTVKIFHSKRRSTGLEEEAKPAPPRSSTKKPSSVVLPSIPPKRPSPVKDLPMQPPEKKQKLDIPERPGAIKLIPPKPKPAVLQESDIFMDALTAATAKKEPKKKKRRASTSKEVAEEPAAPVSPVTSPIGLKNIQAPNFYQDTLEAEQEPSEKSEEKENKPEGNAEPMEVEPVDRGVNPITGLRGVLMYSKKKGPKKSVKFNDSNLTQVRFFELDETERVNVTRTFVDMAKIDISGEREALQMSRKLPNEDTMEAQMAWRIPYLLDQKEPLSVPGSKSKERDVQFAREKDVPQVFYFDKRIVPDSPQEPVPEIHPFSDPINIPLEDSDSQEIDNRKTPWPEPKGSPPHMPEPMPQMFQNMGMQFPNFAPPPFQNIGPRFVQNGPPGAVFNNPPMMPNNLMRPPGDMMQGGPIPPNAFAPPDGYNMMGDNNFQMPFNGPNMGMYPPNNFNMNRGGRGGGFRRGGGNGPWIRMNGPGPGGPPNSWRGGGGGNRGGRLCKNVKNHGYCRNMDKCQFVHPK